MNASIRNLPKYAHGADPLRLVRLLCKGRCCKTRFAEMSVDYPGECLLRNAKVNQFTARCLKCGKIARDPYNWFR
jgi:hypothetical protein